MQRIKITLKDWKSYITIQLTVDDTSNETLKNVRLRHSSYAVTCKRTWV